MEDISVEAFVMKKYHTVENVRIEDGLIKLLVDGTAIEKALKIVSPVLADAPPEKLQVFEISPSGYGMYWPLLDEDISIDGLLGIVHKPERVWEAA